MWNGALLEILIPHVYITYAGQQIVKYGKIEGLDTVIIAKDTITPIGPVSNMLVFCLNPNAEIKSRI